MLKKKLQFIQKKKILDIILKMASLAASDEQVISVKGTFISPDGTLYLLTDPRTSGVSLGDVDDPICIAGLVALSKQMPGKKIVVVICEQDRFNKFKSDPFGSFVYNFCSQDSNQMEMIGETDSRHFDSLFDRHCIQFLFFIYHWWM